MGEIKLKVLFGIFSFLVPIGTLIIIRRLPPELNITVAADFTNTTKLEAFCIYYLGLRYYDYIYLIMKFIFTIFLVWLVWYLNTWCSRTHDEQVADKFAIREQLKSSTDLKTYSHDELEKRIENLPPKEQAAIRKVHADRLQKYHNERDSRQPTEEFTSVDQLYALTKEKKAVLLLGFGTSEYLDIQEAKKHVDDVVGELNTEYGENEWFFVFGGDKYEKLKVDLTHLIKYSYDRHDIKICVVQHDGIKDDSKPFKQIFGQHVHYVYYYEKETYPDTHPKRGRTMYAGWLESKIKENEGNEKGLGGSSKVYFYEKEFISCIVAFGGGAISLDDVKYGLSVGKKLRYCKLNAKDENKLWDSFEKNGSINPVSDFIEQIKRYRLGGDGQWFQLNLEEAKKDGFDVLRCGFDGVKKYL